MLVASDHITDKDYPAVDKVKGDLFVSYPLSNVLFLPSPLLILNVCR